MTYVIGVDLGTSAVKVLLVNKQGDVVQEISKPYPVMQERAGYSEQDPNDWVKQTIAALSEVMDTFAGRPEEIEGISFSGQMHGLVLLDAQGDVLRPAILWNDTRTTAECDAIYEQVGKEKLLAITKNTALEGFTLPKLLWVKKHEPELYRQATCFVLPKDYVRYKLTGQIHMDYSDAAGTLLLDVREKQWSTELCRLLDIDPGLCPPLIDSHEEVGTITGPLAEQTGMCESTRVFAGGADNACGAIGAGILEDGQTMCSIGTSGVVLSYESSNSKDFAGQVHYFNHGVSNAYYTMGVTLSAGNSLTWFREAFAEDVSFDALLADVKTVKPGSNGLLFTPYLSGERTPHADSAIRASFIGLDARHERKHLVRSVLEGITFSLNEAMTILRAHGKQIDTVVSIGGGAKSDAWLQMQADIFDAQIVKLKSEQGPGMGAAMLAAYGCGWFDSLQTCARAFLKEAVAYQPNPERVVIYESLFKIYQDVYKQTEGLSRALRAFD